MRVSFFLGGVIFPLVSLADEGTLRLPLTHARRAVSRRSSGTTTVPLQNAYVEYLVEVLVGTPPQKIQSQLDTGSSDLWFPTASQCPDTATCPYGYFTPSKSSTFAEVAPNEFNITYGDGSGAIGDYFNDTLTIAGTTVKDFTMAVAREVTGEPVIGSVMGVSYPALDASNKGVTYPNYPQALVNSGFINTVAYSLWLDDLAANTGSILFAGVDKAKFCGALEVVDVQPYQGGIYAFYVTLNSISYTTGSGTSTIASTASLALLDSGTSLTAVPQDVLQTIVSQFPTAQYDSQYSVYVVPCSAGQQAGHFTFTFGNKAIRVDLSEYVLQENEQGSCRLGFQASPDDTYILGDTFLRSAYVVYDLVNNQIGLASSSFNGGESDVVAFPSYGAHIPQLTGSCSSTTTTSTSASSTSHTQTSSTPSATKTVPASTTSSNPISSSPPKQASTTTGPVLPPTSGVTPPYQTTTSYPSASHSAPSGSLSISPSAPSSPAFTAGASRLVNVPAGVLVGLVAGAIVF